MKIWPPVWEWRVCNPLAHPHTVNLSFQKSTFIPNTPICNQSRPCHFLYMFILLLITFYLHQVDELLPTIYFFLLIQRFIYLTSSVWARFPNASFFSFHFGTCCIVGISTLWRPTVGTSNPSRKKKDYVWSKRTSSPSSQPFPLLYREEVGLFIISSDEVLNYK
jgi:hypothetical protein